MWAEDDFVDTRDGWLTPDPDSVVQHLRDIQSRRALLLEERATRVDMGALWRLATRRRDRELDRELAVLGLDVSNAQEQLAVACVGAPARVWGPFSGTAGYNLENTLTSLLRGPLASHAAIGRAVTLLESLPRLRLAAYDGDVRVGSHVDETVAQLAEMLGGDSRRMLLEHLSGWARPLPQALDELDRHRGGGRPFVVTVSVSHPLEHLEHFRPDDYQERIQIHDFVVDRSLQGMGLGSAALVELCRFADATAATLVGELGQDHRGDEQRKLEQLARWYGRHGFDCGDTPPERLRRGLRITREPGAPLPQQLPQERDVTRPRSICQPCARNR